MFAAEVRMRRILGWTAVLLLAGTAPAGAQDSDDLVQGILQAMRLPTVTREARLLGVADRDVRDILTMGRDRRVRAGSMAELFAAENDAIRQHGPIDNFGAFVQSKLDAGLRGRDLAAAIQAEHGARGMGKGHMGKADGHGMSGAYGKSDDHGKSGAYGKSDDHGKSDDKGKPDSPGKSDDKGKKGGS